MCLDTAFKRSLKQREICNTENTEIKLLRKDFYKKLCSAKNEIENCLKEDNYAKFSFTGATVFKLFNDILSKRIFNDKLPAELIIRLLQDTTKVSTLYKKSKESAFKPLPKSIAFHDSYVKYKSQNSHAEIK